MKKSMKKEIAERICVKKRVTLGQIPNMEQWLNVMKLSDPKSMKTNSKKELEESLEKQFKDDIKKMYRMYGIEGGAEE